MPVRALNSGNTKLIGAWVRTVTSAAAVVPLDNATGGPRPPDQA
jgi:hypothetical protein